MKTEITERIEDNDLTEPIDKLIIGLNQDFPPREDFHIMTTKLKNLPLLFEIAKNRQDQYGF